MTKMKAADFILVFGGQSLNLLPALTYPHSLADSFPGMPWANRAIGGTSWTDLGAVFDSNVAPYANAARTTVYIGQGGQRDLYTENDTGEVVHADMVADAVRAHTAGFDIVIAQTIPPALSYNGTQDARRITANNLIIASEGTDFDIVVDVASVTGLDDPSSGNYDGGFHWTDAGVALVVATMIPVLEAIPGFPAAV